VILNSTIVLLVLVVAFAGTVGAASRPTPVPTPPPSPGAIQSPGQAMIEQEEAALQGRGYTYDPAGRRDPFRSLLVRPEDRALGARPPGIAGMSIDEFDLSCGTIYETAADSTHATRWYENLLLVERDAQTHVSGTWTLSPTGAGPSVQFGIDLSWHETFLVPGDLSSDSEVIHGSFLRIPALGVGFHASGIGMADGTDHGYFNSFTDEAKAQLCEALGA
jgi:hypothetical protein